MIDLAALAAPLGAFFIAAASPGPATLGVAAVAMSAGRPAAFAYGCGLALGLALWGVVAGAGLGAILAHSVWGMTALRVIGAAYLLWLAFGAARSALRETDGRLDAAGPVAHGRAFRQGLLLNATNPKAVLAWLAVLAVGMPSGGSQSALWITVAACSALGLAIYGALAIGFSIHWIRARYLHARRWIEAIVAVGFGVAAARLVSNRTADGTP